MILNQFRDTDHVAEQRGGQRVAELLERVGGLDHIPIIRDTVAVTVALTGVECQAVNRRAGCDAREHGREVERVVGRGGPVVVRDELQCVGADAGVAKITGRRRCRRGSGRFRCCP